MSSRIEQLIDEIDEFIEGCKFQPLSATKIVVNKEEMEEYLRELRLKTPDEIKRYQKIISNKDAILEDAQTKADALIADAQTKAQELVTQHEIMQKAYAQANETINAANKQAQEILDKMKEDPTADMSEIAKGVDDSYSAVQGNFTTKESEDEDEDSGSEAYPDEVLKVLRGLKDGEVADNIIETDTGYYVVRLDKINDEDATASKRESLQNSKESTYFTDTTAKWLDEADVKVVKKVIKTLKITDKHTFMAPTPTPVPETPTPEVTEEATPTPETEEVTETPAAEDTDVTETPAAEEEAK